MLSEHGVYLSLLASVGLNKVVIKRLALQQAKQVTKESWKFRLELGPSHLHS